MAKPKRHQIQKPTSITSLNSSKRPDSSKPSGMYSSISISNFRSFEQLELHNLARINLFFGPNNSGKTSILEAVYAHACGRNFGPFLRQVTLGRQGGSLSGILDFGEKLKTLFRNTSTLPYTFSISASIVDESKPHTLRSTFWPSSDLADLDPRVMGQFPPGEISAKTIKTSNNATNRISDQTVESISPSVFLGKWETEIDKRVLSFELRLPLSDQLVASPFKLGVMEDILAHRGAGGDMRVFSHLKRYRVLAEFTKEMKRAFPEVHEIDAVPYPDGTQSPVYVITTSGQQMPLYAFGDGMRRWYYLLGQMVAYRNSVQCIEEIDATLHPAACRSLSPLIVEYARKFDNQLFLTSHSIEFADAFLEALYGENGAATFDDDPVRVFTIKPSNNLGRPEIWSLTGREAYEKRRDFELELR